MSTVTAQIMPKPSKPWAASPLDRAKNGGIFLAAVLASFAVVIFSASFFNFIPVFCLYLSQFVFFNTITFVFVYFSVFAVSILLSCWPALDGGDFHLHTTIYDILRPDLI